MEGMRPACSHTYRDSENPGTRRTREWTRGLVDSVALGYFANMDAREVEQASSTQSEHTSGRVALAGRGNFLTGAQQKRRRVKDQRDGRARGRWGICITARFPVGYRMTSHRALR